MFLDLRDQWPPVPPRAPPPETGKTPAEKPRERILGLVVAINLCLLLLALIGGSALVRIIAALNALWPG